LINIGGVIIYVGLLSSSAVDGGFEHGSGESYFEMGICCFPANNTSLRRKSKDWIRTLYQSGTVCLSM